MTNTLDYEKLPITIIVYYNHTDNIHYTCARIFILIYFFFENLFLTGPVQTLSQL